MDPGVLGIFGPGKCAAGCEHVWEKYCKGCNLVFCANHASPVFHKCRSLEEPEQKKEPEPQKEIPLVVPIKSPGRKRKNVSPVEASQTELPLEKPPEKAE